MVGLLQLKLSTSTLVGFLINGLIMNRLQHIFSQAENLVFQFQKSRGRIFLCVSPTFASPIEKPATSALRRICREIIGNTEGNAKTVDSLRHCKKTSSASKSAQKRKKRPEDRSAENSQNGGGGGDRTRVLWRHCANFYMLVLSFLLIVTQPSRQTGGFATLLLKISSGVNKKIHRTRALSSPPSPSTRQGGDVAATQAASAYSSFAVIVLIEVLRGQRSSSACCQHWAHPVETMTPPTKNVPLLLSLQ